MTDEIRDLMATKDAWKRKFKQTNDPLAWSSYKTYCRKEKRKIRLDEKGFMAEQVKANRNNTNTMWKAIRCCFPKKSAPRSFFSKDVNIVANEFNNYFVNIGKNIIQKINTFTEQFQRGIYDISFVPRKYPVSEQFCFDANVNIHQSSVKYYQTYGTEEVPWNR